jgi:hypothetical protein
VDLTATIVLGCHMTVTLIEQLSLVTSAVVARFVLSSILLLSAVISYVCLCVRYLDFSISLPFHPPSRHQIGILILNTIPCGL